MLRAIRFAAKLDFVIDPATAEPMHTLGHLLEPIPAARMFEEILKLLLSGNGEQTYYLLRDYDLFKFYSLRLTQRLKVISQKISK